MKLFTRNSVLFISCFGLAVGMLGATYAAVPLYYMFCRATGYGGTPNRASAAPGVVGNRMITVNFDTSVDPKLPWKFQPEQRSVRVHIGEQKLVFFRAQNLASAAVVGHAAFNVAPDDAAHYFNKIQCFCFTEQKLEAHQSVDMPVVFFISPAILKDQNEDDVSEVTLSYTFYPAIDKTAIADAHTFPVK